MKENSLKMTKPRKLILALLEQKKSEFFSVEELFNIINKDEKVCDLTSVYRTLTSLEEIGVVEKSDFFGEASRYRLAENYEQHHHHHHYFKCDSCGKIEVLCGSCNVHQYENDLSRRGFSNLTHRLELSGLCPTCKK